MDKPGSDLSGQCGSPEPWFALVRPCQKGSNSTGSRHCGGGFILKLRAARDMADGVRRYGQTDRDPSPDLAVGGGNSGAGIARAANGQKALLGR